MAKVKKIVLEIDGKEIRLSVKEAKELKRMLVDLFGNEVHHFYPIRYYEYTPWYRYGGWQVYGDSDTVYFSNTGSGNAQHLSATGTAG